MEKITRSKLTIILQYKDRYDYACRWLKFAYSNCCPFEIIVADGSSSKDIEKYIKKNKLSSRLKIKYLKSDYDQTFKVYYKKILNALCFVKTPYVLLADDDDFYNFKNIKECIYFLEKDQSIVTCGGQTANFKILDGNLKGKKVLLDNANKNDFKNNSLLENLEEYLLLHKGIYYNIHRIKDYKRAWSISSKYNLSPRMCELFIEMYILTSGKAKILPIITYYRQFDHTHNNSIKLENDFFDEMMKYNWHRDLNIVLDTISIKLAKFNKMDHNDIKNKLLEHCKKFFTPWIINNLDIKGDGYYKKNLRKLMLMSVLRNSIWGNLFLMFGRLKSYFKHCIFIQKHDKENTRTFSTFLKNYKKQI